MSDHAVFFGEREHTLDAKGRLIIPSKFRDVIKIKRDGQGLYLTIGLEGCLFLYTEKRWGEIAAQIQGQPFTQKKKRQFQRLFFGSAERVEPDKAGRILIPEHLLNFANLKKDVVMIGVMDRIEFWSATRWQDHKKKNHSVYEELSENLFDSERDV